jgi:F0F1-type ATP synthase epsilon subunit
MSKETLLSLEILTPEGTILKADSLFSINVPLADGSPIGIRPGHAPLIAETLQGSVRFRTAESESQIELHAGVLDIRDNRVIILTPGKVSGTPREIADGSETEYDRLMGSLIEKINLNQDVEV